MVKARPRGFVEGTRPLGSSKVGDHRSDTRLKEAALSAPTILPANWGSVRRTRNLHAGAVAALALFGLAGPALGASASIPRPSAGGERAEYLIGPGDTLQIFVWRNPELSVEAPVRPDGRITIPLVPDVQAQGKTPTELAQSLGQALSAYIQDPMVTVIVKSFASAGNEKGVSVIGEAATPKTVPYRAGLTALDVLIEVGGLNTFARGNGATLLRREADGYHSYPLRLKDLVRSGDLRANVELRPGDVIRIPERLF
jgi:polysaccharide biosynthesis/export protein